MRENDEAERSDGTGMQDGWYYRGTSGRHDFVRGPYSRKEVLSLLKDGKIGPDTPIRWGNDRWRQVKDYLPGTIERVRARKRAIRGVLAAVSILLAFVAYVCLARPILHTGPGWSSTPPVSSPEPSAAMHPPDGAYPGQETLSPAKLVILTNGIRMKSGRPILEENALLNLIAQERLKDMFQKQYFGHRSPTGEEATDIARRVGYRYKLIAENIAAGNFLNNEKVLDGWMQSPGHKRNILAEEPEHIGVAVAKGRLKGSDTWLAVQIFGLPSPPVTADTPRAGKVSDRQCTPPSATLARDIENARARLSEIANILARLSEELRDERARIAAFQSQPVRSNHERSERSTFIAAHNQKVERHNEILAQQRAQHSVLTSMIDEYNRLARAYNECRGAAV